MMLLAITIVPSLAILSYFVYSDKFREPKKSIYKVFGLGITVSACKSAIKQNNSFLV